MNGETGCVTHVESSVHGLSEPDVLAVLALAGPPVLAWDAGRLGVDTRLSSLHVTEDLDGVNGATLVRIDPILSYGRRASTWDQLLGGLHLFTAWLCR